MSDFHKRQQQLMDMSDDDLDDYLAKIDGENGGESGNLTASCSAPIQGSRKTDASSLKRKDTRDLTSEPVKRTKNDRLGYKISSATHKPQDSFSRTGSVSVVPSVVSSRNTINAQSTGGIQQIKSGPSLMSSQRVASAASASQPEHSHKLALDTASNFDGSTAVDTDPVLHTKHTLRPALPSGNFKPINERQDISAAVARLASTVGGAHDTPAATTVCRPQALIAENKNVRRASTVATSTASKLNTTLAETPSTRGSTQSSGTAAVPERKKSSHSLKLSTEVIDLANTSYLPSPSSSPVTTDVPSSDPIVNVPTVGPKTSTSRKAVTRKTSILVQPVKRGKSKKKPERSLTLSEWAMKLQPSLFTPPPGEEIVMTAAARHQILKGTIVFYFGGESSHSSRLGEATRNRLHHLVSYGAVVLPSFDIDKVTHLVHCPRAHKSNFLKTAGLKALDDVPARVPIVVWNWVIRSQAIKKLAPCIDFARWREAPPDYEIDLSFSDKLKKARMGPSRQNSMTPDPSGDGDLSRISEFSDAEPSMHSAGSSSSGIAVHDSANCEATLPISSPPTIALAENSQTSDFFTDAGSERSYGSLHLDSESDEEVQILQIPNKPKGFQCDQIGGETKPTGPCPNQHVIDKLTELRDLHSAKRGDQDFWRVHSYNKAIPSLHAYPKPIQSYEEAKSLRGVGQETAKKIMEIIKTGELRRIGHVNTEDVKIGKLFCGIYGVGPETASDWYRRGCRSLDDLRSGKGGVTLSKVQQIGLCFYEDINLRMPREEAGAIYDLIKPIALGIDPKLFIQIMGSFRRGKATCGDIDILISRDPSDGKTHAGVLERLIRLCKAAGVITEDLVVLDDSQGEKELERVYRGLCRLPNRPGSHRRRIDILTIDWQAKGAALLYYTGDDIFNRSMRLKAHKAGYSLNQRGLWHGVVREPGTNKKLHKGTLLASETEEEIFKILRTPWQEPYQRVRAV